MRRFAFILGLVCAASGSLKADYVVGDLRQYNLVVTGDLTNNSSEVQGRTIVGGNILPASASNYAITSGSVSSQSQDSVIVGGNIGSAINVDNGSVLATSVSGGSVGLNGAGATLTTGSAAGVSNVQSTVIADIMNATTNLSALASNSSITQSGNTYTFTTAPVNGVAVFTLDGSLFGSANNSFKLVNTAGATSIIINVTGTSITDMVNPDSSFASSAVLFNFASATTLNLQRAFNGSILAANATLSNNTQIDGNVYVKTFNQSGEVHYPLDGTPSSLYSGILPTSVPEPASMALMGIGAMGAGFVVRRRNKNASA